MADLIPRFYDPVEGEVIIDGRSLKDYDLESVRRQIGVVTQESILFNDTVFNNIAFGLKNAAFDDVVRAAKIANAHDFIMEMEQGYETMIGERGGMTSSTTPTRRSMSSSRPPRVEGRRIRSRSSAKVRSIM